MDGIQGEIEVIYRDPLEVIQDIYGSPTYCEQMKFAPERHWEDEDRTSRVYHEMHTGKWWWRKQVSCAPPFTRRLNCLVTLLTLISL